MGGLSIWHWVVVLVVVVLIFGTKKLKNVGKDLGEGIQGFKDGLKGKDEPPSQLGNDRRDAPPSETSSKVDTERKDT